MQEETKDDKIHGNKSVSIKKDIKEDDNKNENQSQKDENQLLIKRFYTIDGIKYIKKKVQIEVEKIQSLDKESYKGITLDVKK